MVVVDVARCSPHPGCTAPMLRPYRGTSRSHIPLVARAQAAQGRHPGHIGLMPYSCIPQAIRTKDVQGPRPDHIVFAPSLYRVPQPGLAHSLGPITTSHTRFTPNLYSLRAPQPSLPCSLRPATSILHAIRDPPAFCMQFAHHNHVP